MPRALQVPNLVGGPTEYEVLCTLDCVAGPATVKVTGTQATSYKVGGGVGGEGGVESLILGPCNR